MAVAWVNVMAPEADFNPSQIEPSQARPSRVGDELAASGPGATPVHLAAVDLGSNTFHLLVARIDQGEPRAVERLKFRVGLAAGLLADGTLDAQHFAMACDAMRRMADRIGGIPRAHIRAVGTSTLRSMRDPSAFLDAAAGILGVPVRIVSGEEEAELIFAGATDTLPETRRERLVIDIGGGSTELALGSGHRPRVCSSLALGCVPFSRRALAAESPRAGLLDALAWARELCRDPRLDRFVDSRGESGVEVVGTSGTIESLRDVQRARGVDSDRLTLAGLRELFDLLAAGPALPRPLPGLAPEREDVFPGGLVVMIALWERLGFEYLHWAEGALQDGLIRALIPIPEEGLKARTLAALKARFSVDLQHSEDLSRVAAALFAGCADALELTPEDGDLLASAASVHDIGLAVAAAHHERHGAWLLRNAELRGFTLDERLMLIALVRGHRGAWPEIAINALAAPLRPVCARLCILLRLAVILKRAASAPLPELAFEQGRLELHPASAWCDDHPLLTEALEREAALLTATPHVPRLTIRLP